MQNCGAYSLTSRSSIFTQVVAHKSNARSRIHIIDSQCIRIFTYNHQTPYSGFCSPLISYATGGNPSAISHDKHYLVIRISIVIEIGIDYDIDNDMEDNTDESVPYVRFTCPSGTSDRNTILSQMEGPLSGAHL